MHISRSAPVALALSAALGAVALAAAPAPPALITPEQTVFFEKQVRPVLAERCFSCHGAKVQQAGLRLDTGEGLRKGADTGAVVVPGDPERSLLIQALRFTGPVKMPPAGKLRADEIASLETWIRQGAPWPTPNSKLATPSSKPSAGPFWSFQPVRRPAPPSVKKVAWVKSPIDAFVLAEMEKRGLSPAPPADRRTLIRRATFDLIGLPPTPEEVDAFLADRSPNAYAKVVDRLLASPHYGERWGRHWLDVVRYADTAGETADYPVREAYRYRNYVIDSLNRDKPYDQFVREQVAGDLLAASGPRELYAERVAATGFLATARRFGFDPQNYHHLTLEDTIDTLGKSILGLSVGCARCHDHKFDPIPSADYYGLYGIFASTRYAFPGSEEVKRPRDFVPLVPPDEAARLQKEFEGKLAAFTSEAAGLEAERTRLRAGIGADGDMEFQEIGAPPSTPWGNGPNSLNRIRESAQSPYTHVFPPGTRGVAFENTGAYSGFMQQFAAPWTPASKRYLYYSVDFRNRTVAAGGTGSYRYYIGHSPGASAAVELFVNGDTLFARSGDSVEPVAAVRVGQWYNLQLTLDLQEKTYSGTLGKPGELIRFGGKSFASRWDGIVDTVFVDTYGHVGGVRPGHDVDNFTLRDTPIPAIDASGSQTVSTGASAVNTVALRPRLRDLETRLAAITQQRSEMMEHGAYEVAYAVTEGTPHDEPIQRRGDPKTPGDVVPRHFLAALGGATLPAGAVGSGRLQLAEWLTDPRNPLTARVMVNRVWQHHFGHGLVRTPNDFGHRGTPPTHPALLDWLASSFAGQSLGSRVQGIGPNPNKGQQPRNAGSILTPASPGSGSPRPNTLDPKPWSVKNLHRLIMLSSTYQMASTESPRAVKVDPENRWLSHQARQRLEAEAIRDSMLAVSGDLDPTMGGAHPFPPVTAWGFSQHAPFTATYETRRRSVYLMSQRIRKHPFLALFDGAEPNASTPERPISTTPIQALFMMNDPFVHDQAGKLSTRLLAEAKDEPARIDRGYRLCFGRPPSAEDLAGAKAFLNTARAALTESGTPAADLERASWASFVRALLSSNEFLFVD